MYSNLFLNDNEAPHEKAWPIVGTTPEDMVDNEAPHERYGL